MELDKSRIEDAIVQQVSADIMREDELRDRVKRAVDARIDKIFSEQAEMQIAAAVNAAIKDAFDREYCRIDAFGRKEGKSTSIRAQLQELVEGYWNTKVDRNGKPSNEYGNKVTRAEWVMMQLTAADFHGEMKQHIVNIGGALKDGLRAKLHETVNSLLSETFSVKSIGDMALKDPGRSIIQPPVNLPTAPKS